jgi:hypothetical protein
MQVDHGDEVEEDMAYLICVLGGVFATTIATVAATTDGRSFRAPRSTTYTIRTCPWNPAAQDPGGKEGWFRNNLRCSYSNFLKLVRLVEQHCRK